MSASRRSVGLAIFLSAFLLIPVAEATARTLSLEERVAAQTAIERVYWSHRTWPTENPGPKPPLEAVLPANAIRAKVDDYLRKSQALEALWHSPITAEQLEAEMKRMADASQRPDILREIQVALGDDAHLVAECVARPILADRLLRNRYARDDARHGALRRSARASLEADPSVAGMKTSSGVYGETTWSRSSGDAAAQLEAELLDGPEWDERLRELEARFPESGPVPGAISALHETDDAFVVTAILERATDSIRVASVTWPKVSFDSWWANARTALSAALPAAEISAPLPLPVSAGCTADTWTPTKLDAPEPRGYHLAVWTGSEMIVWGGESDSALPPYAWRYDPATALWTAGSAVGAPEARPKASAVWTGTELIVWGGGKPYGNPTTYFDTGARYRPLTDTWTPVTMTGAPTARGDHRAVWTGSRMIVWGGYSSTTTWVNTGARYDPSTDAWTPTTQTNAPSVRSAHAAVWSGQEMLVWGGLFGGNLPVIGGRYNPVTDTWVAMSTAGQPLVRYGLAGVWSGSEFLIWGGGYAVHSGDNFGPGGRYRPDTDTWATMSATNEPYRRYDPLMVWTGTRMIVWGGNCGFACAHSDSGGVYDPAANSWQATSLTDSPGRRRYHTAVWSGSRMIVWGGQQVLTGAVDGYKSTGAEYDWVSDTWTPTGVGSVPGWRAHHVSVWTGSEMIVWGETTAATSAPGSGGRYDPATDTWIPTTQFNAPSNRGDASAIWTGSEMIVWGGRSGSTNLSNGGRYSPLTDSWLATSSGPSGRRDHSAVWTGSAMIVWGGLGPSALNTGSQFNPTTNQWTPTSGTNAPSARSSHVAVWTGSRMIVFGGSGTASTGGQFDPLSNSWTATATTNAPAAATESTGIWTGTRMIVWGGGTTVAVDTGGRYDPIANSWEPTSTAGAASARLRHSAVWTGDDMIVWGGDIAASTAGTNTGGRYDPVVDVWSTTSTSAAPQSRYSHTAVWNGRQMIVWGGTPLTLGGGLYCACPGGATVYRDADGDGFGDPQVTADNCSGAPAAGYVTVAGDCDDADPAVHPGAAQVCDGQNNDCADPSWPALPAAEANADGDPFRVCSGDCDDSDPAVYPGAAEVCDAQNNNCSDPSWPALPPSEADADGDSYRVCAGDCNDANPAVRPGATEVCNGIDDDCDALTDEDALGQDSDADGVKNLCDNCPSAANPSQLDTDSDTRGNACDNCLTVFNPNQADPDADGRGTACDNCPLELNPAQDDSDLDGDGDVCDNCIFAGNESQSDLDQDGEGDVCDLDDGEIYLYRDDDVSIAWQPESGPSSFNVYEGDLDVLKSTGAYTQAPGANPYAERRCGEVNGFVDDLETVATGKVVFALVSGVTAGIEGSLGTDGTGTPRPNTNPCP